MISDSLKGDFGQAVGKDVFRKIPKGKAAFRFSTLHNS